MAGAATAEAEGGPGQRANADPGPRARPSERYSAHVDNDATRTTIEALLHPSVHVCTRRLSAGWLIILNPDVSADDHHLAEVDANRFVDLLESGWTYQPPAGGVDVLFPRAARSRPLIAAPGRGRPGRRAGRPPPPWRSRPRSRSPASPAAWVGQGWTGAASPGSARPPSRRGRPSPPRCECYVRASFGRPIPGQSPPAAEESDRLGGRPEHALGGRQERPRRRAPVRRRGPSSPHARGRLIATQSWFPPRRRVPDSSERLPSVHENRMDERLAEDKAGGAGGPGATRGDPGGNGARLAGSAWGGPRPSRGGGKTAGLAPAGARPG